METRRAFYVKQLLEDKDYDVELPTYTCEKSYSDRVHKFELPIISGYLFVRVAIAQHTPVLQTAGVMGILKIGEHYTPVPDAEIDLLMAAAKAQNELRVRPAEYIEARRNVEIIDGPLSGYKAIFGKYLNNGNVQVTLLLDGIQSAFKSEVSRDQVKAC